MSQCSLACSGINDGEYRANNVTSNIASHILALILVAADTIVTRQHEGLHFLLWFSNRNNMRLLAAISLEFKEFERENSTPKYAILSHTWGADGCI